MHYFFYVFAVALMFHAPASALPNGGFAPIVFGTMIVWYFLDMMYCMVFMSERIDTTIFDVLPSGVQMTLAVSERYITSFTGGYCYICLPWVDKTQVCLNDGRGFLVLWLQTAQLTTFFCSGMPSRCSNILPIQL